MTVYTDNLDTAVSAMTGHDKTNVATMQPLTAVELAQERELDKLYMMTHADNLVIVSYLDAIKINQQWTQMAMDAYPPPNGKQPLFLLFGGQQLHVLPKELYGNEHFAAGTKTSLKRVERMMSSQIVKRNKNGKDKNTAPPPEPPMVIGIKAVVRWAMSIIKAAIVANEKTAGTHAAVAREYQADQAQQQRNDKAKARTRDEGDMELGFRR